MGFKLKEYPHLALLAQIKQIHKGGNKTPAPNHELSLTKLISQWYPNKQLNEAKAIHAQNP